MNILKITHPHYYSEWDKEAAQWLRNLIARGLLPPGDVDDRSIEDVTPADLIGYTQCHFFAGVGGWPLALQLAGWPVEREIWTGSCPCQPFSAAGAGAGFADERHLWPLFAHLIQQRRPAVVAGEQVASGPATAWLDLVQDDLEAMAYAFAATAFPAASVGAPHIRDRSYWVGYADDDARLEGLGLGHQAQGGRLGTVRPASGAGESVRLADGHQLRQQPTASAGLHDAEHHVESRSGAEWLGHSDGEQQSSKRSLLGRTQSESAGRCEPSWLANPDGITGTQGCAIDSRGYQGSDAITRPGSGSCGGVDMLGTGVTAPSRVGGGGLERPGPVNGQWKTADWLGCRDAKWRPVEPGTFPLAHGIPSRVVRLRAYGNAIVPAQAAQFIRAAEGARRAALAAAELL